MDPDAFIAELWGYAHALEMREHPWFKGVVEHRWTREQIVRGEMQHYLRVSQNPVFFGYIVTNVTAEKNYELMPIVMENFMEELGGEKTHVDVMLQMLEEAGIVKAGGSHATANQGTNWGNLAKGPAEGRGARAASAGLAGPVKPMPTILARVADDGAMTFSVEVRLASDTNAAGFQWADDLVNELNRTASQFKAINGKLVRR